MAGGDARIHIGGAGGQGQGRLGDVLIRMGFQALAEGFGFRPGGGGPHQHAVAPGAVHLPHHQLGQAGQGIGQVLRLAAHVGGHVVQDGFFPQVKTHHVRHIGVDGLVVRHPGAHGVGQGHPARPVGPQNARHPQHGIGTEHLGIHEVVVDTPVDHIHPLGPLGGAHVPRVVFPEPVPAFHQFNAHLLGQEGVFEIGRIVGPRGQKHGRWPAFAAPRRDGLEHVEQKRRIVVHRTDVDGAEDLGKGALQDAAVGQDVGHARGTAQVVLQDEKAARGVAHEIRAGNVAPDALGRLEAQTLLEIAGGGLHHRSGHDPVGHDAGLTVHVVDEGIERRDALGEPPFQKFPFGGLDDPGDDVEGKDLFRPVFVAVDGEGDAHVVKGLLGDGLPGQDLAGVKRNNLVIKHAASGPGATGRLEHLIEEGAEIVRGKVHGRGHCNASLPCGPAVSREGTGCVATPI